MGRTNTDVRQQDGAEGASAPRSSDGVGFVGRFLKLCGPLSTGGVVGAEAGVGAQHSPGDPGEAGPPAGRAEGAHPPPQDAKPHPGAPAQHQPQVS